MSTTLSRERKKSAATKSMAFPSIPLQSEGNLDTPLPRDMQRKKRGPKGGGKINENSVRLKKAVTAIVAKKMEENRREEGGRRKERETGGS
jgi:hypothetical protein